MRVEAPTDLAFRPNLAKAHFAEYVSRGIEAPKASEIVRGELERDLTYYFLEQYAKVRLVNYSYQFSGQDLVSPKYEYQGDVCGMYKKSIIERQINGLPTDREEAEYMSMQMIKNDLRQETEEKSFVLVSRPPAGDDRNLRAGYGEYSMVYFGQYQPEKRKIDMFAWRNNLTLAEQTTVLNKFLGDEDKFDAITADPNDLLKKPILKSGNIDAFVQEFNIAAGVNLKKDDFDNAQEFKLANYSEGLNYYSNQLANLVSDGLSEDELNIALVSIEGEFIKWVNGETISHEVISYREDEVRMRFLEVSRRFDLSQFSGGHCGKSGFSRFSAFGGSGVELSSMLTSGVSLSSGSSEDEYGTREIHCEECGAKYMRDSGKLEEKCRKCGGKKGIVC